MINNKFIRSIVLNAEQISGNDEGMAYALSASEGYEYINGAKTENITHTKIQAVFPDKGFEKLTVKVMTTNIPVTPEQFSSENRIAVKFINLRGKIYRTSDGDYAISASADRMEVMK